MFDGAPCVEIMRRAFLSFFVRSPRLLLAGVALALLSGCTSADRAVSELAAPTAWEQGASGALDAEALSTWWRQFRDPVLDQLVAKGLASNTDLRIALARIDESKARRGMTRSALLPSLNGSADARVRWNRDARTDLETSSDSYAGALDAGWEIDWSGKLRKALRAADADLAVAAENHRAAQVAVAAEIADAYVSLRVAEAQLGVIRRNVGASAETAEMTRWREQAGEGTALATQQAESSLRQARASIPGVEEGAAQARHRIELLAGTTPGSLNGLLAGGRSIPNPPAKLAAGIPADALRNRPDVRAAEQALLAAAARTQAAEREQLPSLSLGGTIGVEALSAGRIFSPELAAASAAGQLTAPIFNGGRLREAIRLQSAQERQALVAWEAAVLGALSEVEDALVAVRKSDQRLALLSEAVQSAREAESLARLNFQAGEIDVLDVLVAQRTLLSLEESQAIAEGNRASAHIQLYKALGGGWTR